MSDQQPGVEPTQQAVIDSLAYRCVRAITERFTLNVGDASGTDAVHALHDLISGAIKAALPPPTPIALRWDVQPQPTHPKLREIDDFAFVVVRKTTVGSRLHLGSRDTLEDAYALANQHCATTPLLWDIVERTDDHFFVYRSQEIGEAQNRYLIYRYARGATVQRYEETKAWIG